MQKNAWMEIWGVCICSFQRPPFQKEPAPVTIWTWFSWGQWDNTPSLSNTCRGRRKHLGSETSLEQSNIKTIFLALKSKDLRRSRKRKTPKLSGWPELQLFMKGEKYLSFIFWSAIADRFFLAGHPYSAALPKFLPPFFIWSLILSLPFPKVFISPKYSFIDFSKVWNHFTFYFFQKLWSVVNWGEYTALGKNAEKMRKFLTTSMEDQEDNIKFNISELACNFFHIVLV